MTSHDITDVIGGWGVSCRGGVCHGWDVSYRAGWGESSRGGVGCILQGWVCHTGVVCVIVGWGVSCRVEWIMKGWVGHQA